MSKEFDENGTYLSGGEYQKIIISRAYLKQADLIIFDEPSSSLDVLSEKNIFSNAFKKHKDKSMIFITHKLSNIKNIDRIYFIQDGKAVESGTHNELMRKKGYYYTLFTQQSDGYLNYISKKVNKITINDI